MMEMRGGRKRAGTKVKLSTHCNTKPRGRTRLCLPELYTKATPQPFPCFLHEITGKEMQQKLLPNRTNTSESPS